MNRLIDIENWKETTKGLYRYVVAANACYEIHILYHLKDTPLLTAKANLFLVGDWQSTNGDNFFERECLLAEQPVQECLEATIKDYKEAVGID